MAILVVIDLDLEDNLSKVYKDTKDTIEYLQTIAKSIEGRVLEGEKIPGLKVVDGRQTRFITEPGLKHLAHSLGEDVVYEKVVKPINITGLEKLVDAKEMAQLITLGYIQFKEGNKKVELD